MRGPLFYSSVGAIGQNHGVFGVQQPPPQAIVPTGTGAVAFVGQTAWGPSSGDTDNVHACTGMQDALNTFFPLGMGRSYSAYLMLISGSWPTLYGVRVVGNGAARASATLTGGGSSIKVFARWPGTEGNSITATVSAASDGNALHFNLTISVSNSLGTTTEIFQNLNCSNSGTIALPSVDATGLVTNAVLLGYMTITTNGVPTNGTYTFTGGTNGSAVVSTDYVGTQAAGVPNKGLALLESNDLIRHVFVDDPGSTLRSAVNTGMMNHVNYLLDRTGYICGPSGQTTALVQTDVLNYVSTNIVYTDPWVYVYDDNGTKQLVPSNWLAASVGANASPSTSFAWRNLILRKYLGTVVGLEYNRGSTKAANTALGISTIIPFKGGGYAFEAAKVTANATSQATGNWTRTQMGIYIATAVEDSLNADVDQPNVLLNQQQIMMAIDSFLDGLVKNKDVNPNTAPYIQAYSLQPINAANTAASQAAGNFIVAASVKIGSNMERIIFSITYGETVTITPVSS